MKNNSNTEVKPGSKVLMVCMCIMVATLVAVLWVQYDYAQPSKSGAVQHNIAPAPMVAPIIAFEPDVQETPIVSSEQALDDIIKARINTTFSNELPPPSVTNNGLSLNVSN